MVWVLSGYKFFSLRSKAKLFIEHQNPIRKAVNRVFEVLQARFTIICDPAQYINKVDSGSIIKTYVILHNMIVEDKRDSYVLVDDYENAESTT